MSKHNEYTIKDLIDKMLQVYGLDRKLAEKKLISSWESVMGGMIAKHTKDIFIIKQQLFITLDSSALRNELSMAKSKIISMMNEAAGEAVINEIIFK
jgi:predicted nucleic acid-binding Zn ribbon protein